MTYCHAIIYDNMSYREEAMPTQTFSKLPEEKKRRIFLAIYDELKRVPFPEISINQIIKNAGIPRGSFYQYFENKEDAFDYFIEEAMGRLENYISEKILSVHGDIFEIAEEIFVAFATEGYEYFGSDMIRHAIPYIDMKKISPFSSYFDDLSKEKRIQTFSALGIGNLKIKNEEEILDVIAIIEALLHSMMPAVYAHPERLDEFCGDFRRRLEIIKRAMT